MADLHSVWLMPCAADEDRLDRIVDELAGVFGTPRFLPHLTLVEDNPTDFAQLRERVAALGGGAAAFDMAVSGVEASALYYRSLFARFASEGPMLDLKRRCIETIAPSPLAAFMPHISLLYGAPDTPRKRETVASLGQLLGGSPVRFDSVAMVRSAQSIPIAEWRIAAEFPLQAKARS